MSTFCSIIKLCIKKDNPLVPFLSATPISVCRMRKSLNLSVRVSIRLTAFYSPLPLLRLLWNKVIENYWKLLKLIVNDCNKSRFELLEYTPRVHFLRHLWNERAERHAGFPHWAVELEVEPTLRKSEQMLSLSMKILIWEQSEQLLSKKILIWDNLISDSNYQRNYDKIRFEKYLNRLFLRKILNIKY